MCFPFHTTQNMATSHVVLPLWGIGAMDVLQALPRFGVITGDGDILA